MKLCNKVNQPCQLQDMANPPCDIVASLSVSSYNVKTVFFCPVSSTCSVTPIISTRTSTTTSIPTLNRKTQHERLTHPLRNKYRPLLRRPPPNPTHILPLRPLAPASPSTNPLHPALAPHPLQHLSGIIDAQPPVDLLIPKQLAVDGVDEGELPEPVEAAVR
jgi:hypothetical protein